MKSLVGLMLVASIVVGVSHAAPEASSTSWRSKSYSTKAKPAAAKTSTDAEKSSASSTSATKSSASPTSATKSSASPTSATKSSAPARQAGAPRKLEDIHIEGEIPVPQVLFITARDQRRFLDFHHHRYLRTSRELGEATTLPSRVVILPATAATPEAAR